MRFFSYFIRKKKLGRPKIPKEEERRRLKALKRYPTFEKAARALKINSGTLRSWARRRGILKRGRYKLVSKQELKLACSLRRKGFSVKEIARRIGIKKARVSYILFTKVKLKKQTRKK